MPAKSKNLIAKPRTMAKKPKGGPDQEKCDKDRHPKIFCMSPGCKEIIEIRRSIDKHSSKMCNKCLRSNIERDNFGNRLFKCIACGELKSKPNFSRGNEQDRCNKCSGLKKGPVAKRAKPEIAVEQQSQIPFYDPVIKLVKSSSLSQIDMVS